MAFELIWSEPAVADLDSILNQLARTKLESALETGEAITRTVEVLRSFPRIGPFYLKDPRRIIREIACGKYRIFYKVNDEEQRVEILTIWHSARQEPSPSRFMGGSN